MTDTVTLPRSVVEQAQVNSPEIPEGWKLVPVKPTEDMLNAVAWPGCAATDWEHMLAAAPQPPVVEQPQVEQEPVAHSIVAGALFDFMGWLTSRRERLVLSSTDDAASAADAIKDFAKMRSLSISDAQVQKWQEHLSAPQPPRQPLTDKVRSLIGSMVSELRAHRYCGDCYPENGWPEVNSVLAEYAAFKRAHGIGGEA